MVSTLQEVAGPQRPYVLPAIRYFFLLKRPGTDCVCAEATAVAPDPAQQPPVAPASKRCSSPRVIRQAQSGGREVKRTGRVFGGLALAMEGGSFMMRESETFMKFGLTSADPSPQALSDFAGAIRHAHMDFMFLTNSKRCRSYRRLEGGFLGGIYKDLGVTSLAELEAAAKEDRIKKAKGLGAALQTKILQNLAIAKSGGGRLHLHRAAALLEHVTASLRSARPELRRLTVAGDFRRGCELVGDLALVAEAPSSENHVAVPNSSELKVHLADRKHFGAALLQATGSAAHLDELRALAERKDMRLESDGLRKGCGIVAAKEEDIYRALGLPFIEPELREGRGEIERALQGKLPKLVADEDLHGILHCHTDASDGTETLARMAKATRERGFGYFGVADHSRSAHYGLSVEQIEEQHREADRLNKAFGKEFRILKGIESDILADGSLDYPDEVLDQFDFVVASIHGRFKLDRKAQTDRLLRADFEPAYHDPPPHDRKAANASAGLRH